MLKLGKGAVIVETRPLGNLPLIISSHMKMLDHTWGLTIYHGDKNKNMIYDNFPEARKIQVGKMGRKEYNNLLTSYEFWDSLPYEKVLIFQHDSLLLRKGMRDFLKWDYIGAPWGGNRIGGNGGLSLRSRAAMMDIIKSCSRHTGNEDVYFSGNLQGTKKKYAPFKVCREFSCEMHPCLGTLGCHALFRYAHGKLRENILNQYKKPLKM